MKFGRTAVRRLLIFIVAVAVAGLGFGAPAAAQDTQDFTINSFEADYYLSRDEQRISKLSVTEKIEAQFPNYDQNHGILRAIPQKYKDHSVNLKITKVTGPDGKEAKYSTSTENDNTVLKIGDANRYVHGKQQYSISYTMQNVTSAYDNHDEFFWDINGDQWQQPFGSVVARLHVPTDLAGGLQGDKRCYTGAYGSTEQDCTIKTAKEKDGVLITMASTRPFDQGETLSIVTGFASGTFVAYAVPLSQILWIIAAVVGLGILPPAIALELMLRKWRLYGRDAKSRGIIVPQYIPPTELSVLGSNQLLAQRFVASAVSAQILDLAVRRYIKVLEHVEKKTLRKDKVTYSLELTKTTRGLMPEEKEVVAMLFGAEAAVGDVVDLSDLSNKLYKKSANLGKTLDKQLAADGYFIKPPAQIFQRYLTLGIVLMVFGIVFPPYTLGLLLAGLTVVIMARLMPARTQKGVDMRDYLFGLRDYMKLAEADRIKALQSPNGKLTEKIDTTDDKQVVKLYEKLLPYAMLFGIEKEWAKQFAELYHEQPPSWYSGTSTFNAVYFAGAISGISTASSVAFSPPSSSSGSGFSGGSAGGGGGGGGGGGW